MMVLTREGKAVCFNSVGVLLAEDCVLVVFEVTGTQAQRT